MADVAASLAEEAAELAIESPEDAEDPEDEDDEDLRPGDEDLGTGGFLLVFGLACGLALAPAIFRPYCAGGGAMSVGITGSPAPGPRARSGDQKIRRS